MFTRFTEAQTPPKHYMCLFSKAISPTFIKPEVHFLKNFPFYTSFSLGTATEFFWDPLNNLGACEVKIGMTIKSEIEISIFKISQSLELKFFLKKKGPSQRSSSVAKVLFRVCLLIRSKMFLCYRTGSKTFYP